MDIWHYHWEDANNNQKTEHKKIRIKISRDIPVMNVSLLDKIIIFFKKLKRF